MENMISQPAGTYFDVTIDPYNIAQGTVDCLVAQIAIEHGLVLFHKDRDYDRIAGVDKKLRILRLPAD